MTSERGRRVLVTGVAGSFGGLVARAIEARDDVELVLGVDVREPSGLARTRFVHADIANPLVAKHLRDDRIDTLVHASLMSAPGEAGGRARMKERNVISSMQLFAAATDLPDLRRVVLRSTTAVYGSDHRDPAAFREDDAPRGAPEHGAARDAVEVEGYLAALAQRRPELEVTVLRLANLVGPSVEGPFDALLTLPIVPSVAGFDPRLQFVHEDDALAVVERVLDGGAPGTYNVAGTGVLYLSQCVRLVRRLRAPVPAPLIDTVSALIRRVGRVEVAAEQLRYLRFGRVVDTARLEERLGLALERTSREAFEDHVRHHHAEGGIDLAALARVAGEAAAALRRRAPEAGAAARAAAATAAASTAGGGGGGRG